jgi:hypothetical protein
MKICKYPPCNNEAVTVHNKGPDKKYCSSKCCQKHWESRNTDKRRKYMIDFHKKNPGYSRAWYRKRKNEKSN